LLLGEPRRAWNDARATVEQPGNKTSSGALLRRIDHHTYSECEAVQPVGATVIKCYAGRRLYDTAQLIYLTRDHLAEMVLNGERFVILEAETGKDITRAVLDALH
jgi:hypothetical protein